MIKKQSCISYSNHTVSRKRWVEPQLQRGRTSSLSEHIQHRHYVAKAGWPPFLSTVWNIAAHVWKKTPKHTQSVVCFQQNYCASVVCGPSSAAVEFRTDLKEMGMCSSSSWAQTHTAQHKLSSVRVTRIPVMADWMKLIHPSANHSLFRAKFENKSPLQMISSASLVDLAEQVPKYVPKY